MRGVVFDRRPDQRVLRSAGLGNDLLGLRQRRAAFRRQKSACFRRSPGSVLTLRDINHTGVRPNLDREDKFWLVEAIRFESPEQARIMT